MKYSVANMLKESSLIVSNGIEGKQSWNCSSE
jgi:hypothetical protein